MAHPSTRMSERWCMRQLVGEKVMGYASDGAHFASALLSAPPAGRHRLHRDRLRLRRDGRPLDRSRVDVEQVVGGALQRGAQSGKGRQLLADADDRSRPARSASSRRNWVPVHTSAAATGSSLRGLTSGRSIHNRQFCAPTPAQWKRPSAARNRQGDRRSDHYPSAVYHSIRAHFAEKVTNPRSLSVMATPWQDLARLTG
jgi:hypothetical protein